MNRYYVKDGYEEKGPYTVEELKKIRIGKFTLVRLEDDSKWNQSDSVSELNEVFKSNLHFIKIGALIILILSLIAVSIFGISRLKFDSGSSSSNNILEDQIPLPPQIDYKITQHKKKFFRELFKGCNLSGTSRQLVDACNYTNETVRNSAVSLAGKSAGAYNLGQICDVFDYCYNNWKYVNDPKEKNLVAFASSTIQNGLNGDCDDFAVLVCSMVLAIGGESRINYAYAENDGHAFTEVNIGKSNTNEIENYISKRYKSVYTNSIWSRTDNEGNQWLNLDWFAKHPGGKYFNFDHGTTFYILQEYCENFEKPK
jgi:transglutaminase-like putative cysteine protease